MEMPPLEYCQYVTLRSLNLYDNPKLGAKITGVIPASKRIYVVDWKMLDDSTTYACIGGYPAQWISAYRNFEKNINIVMEEK